MTNTNLVDLLKAEYKKFGNLLKIVCPFHDDTNPSLIIYPEISRGFWCPSCGTAGTYEYLYKELKGCDWTSAYNAMGTASETKAREWRPEFEFCSPPEFVQEIQKRWDQCTPLPEVAQEFLDRKGILDAALEEDWRWFDKGVFPQVPMGGIAIPYREEGDLVYIRLRPYDGTNFLKPISLKGVESRPYILLTPERTRVWIVEGESDALSLWSMGKSVIATPGCMVKKVLNTAIRLANYLDFSEIMVAGDSDGPGMKMNQYVKDSAPRLGKVPVSEYSPSPYKDMNERLVANDILLPPFDPIKTILGVQYVKHAHSTQASNMP